MSINQKREWKEKKAKIWISGKKFSNVCKRFCALASPGILRRFDCFLCLAQRRLLLNRIFICFVPAIFCVCFIRRIAICTKKVSFLHTKQREWEYDFSIELREVVKWRTALKTNRQGYFGVFSAKLFSWLRSWTFHLTDETVKRF
jgi:hypothetical protein